MVLDIGLPGMDGFAVLERARGQGSTAPGDHPDRAGLVHRHGGRAWRAVPTTTWPSRSGSRSCWPGCGCGCGHRPAQAASVLSHGELSWTCGRGVVTSAARRSSCRPGSSRLLETFLRHPGQVLSREQLLSRGLGLRLRSRVQRRRRLRPLPAEQDRQRPDRHRAGALFAGVTAAEPPLLSHRRDARGIPPPAPRSPRRGGGSCARTAGEGSMPETADTRARGRTRMLVNATSLRGGTAGGLPRRPASCGGGPPGPAHHGGRHGGGRASRRPSQLAGARELRQVCRARRLVRLRRGASAVRARHGDRQWLPLRRRELPVLLEASGRRAFSRLESVACSGASTVNLVATGSVTEPAQLSALSGRTRTVTVTIGGNDAGFGAVFRDCVYSPDPASELRCRAAPAVSSATTPQSAPGSRRSPAHRAHWGSRPSSHCPTC